MSIFKDIMSRIFRGSTMGAQPQTPDEPAVLTAGPPPAANGQPGPSEAGRLGGQAAPRPEPSATLPAAGPTPAEAVDVEAVLTAVAAQTPQRLDWRRSIVDLMKLLELDGSLSARKDLARELGYTGAMDGSAEMNMWLHRAVMRRLAENGGRVPHDLLS